MTHTTVIHSKRETFADNSISGLRKGEPKGKAAPDVCGAYIKGIKT
jgi:hypothetical protein